MITVDDDGRGGYLVRAVGAMPPGRTPADIVRLHTDADAAAVFGDVGRYESFECSETGNVCVASWKIGKMTVAVRKRVVDDRIDGRFARSHRGFVDDRRSKYLHSSTDLPPGATVASPRAGQTHHSREIQKRVR